ncbi:MAG: NUDIX hydrolase [Magnetococcales bacterium]|nr:NUDIX hydrolase [Magnetococcales bacterium]
MGQERPDSYYDQSAVIPYRVEGEVLQILMITSRRKKRWIIPKGIVESDLSPADSAAKEALEEAGIKGEVWPLSLGRYSYPKWGGVCRAEVFAMAVSEVRERWDEAFRDREWVDLAEAIERVKESELKEILATLPEFLAQNSG